MATMPINGWESYPLCLPSSFYDVDRKRNSRLLDSAEGRLFSDHDDVEVWAYESSIHSMFEARCREIRMLMYQNKNMEDSVRIS